MFAFRFFTRVSKKGTINLPDKPEFHDQEVEVIVLPKAGKRKHRKNGSTAKKFVAKWAGFMSDTDTEEAKFNYLQDKYK